MLKATNTLKSLVNIYIYRAALSLLILFLSFIIIGLCNSAPTSATDIPTSVTIKLSLGLTLSSSSVALNLDPTTNPFDNETINIIVGTNNPTGYWLTMSSNNNDTSLINTNDTTKTIPTLESNISEADFPANHWGYKVSSNSGTGDSNTNYLPYISGATIASNNTKVNNDTTNLTIASKIDYLSVPGLYKQTFNFTALPHITNYYMQDLSNPTLAQEVCTTDRPSIVIDKRDEQAYTIQRLPDGKCWMLDNLNLDLTNASIVAGLSPENTNADTASLKSLRQGNRTDCGEADCSKYATSGLSLENWEGGSSSYTVPMVKKSGTCSTSSDFPCTYNGNYTNNDILSTLTPNQSTFGLGSGRIGVFYNYCAASAGSYCYDSSGAGAPSAGTNANYDVCPTNWRVPTGGVGGEYASLCAILNGNACGDKDGAGVGMDATSPNSLQYKLSLLLSGSYSGTREAIVRQGTNGRFWSSTFISIGNMHDLQISSTNVYPQNYPTRNGGEAVRCLLQE
ncbi:hypothetical protein IKF23_03100 [Candidatus Saccharibacteria bacterium]|nr:hypothetical protein [Candidatus Saccharibacteria bacterium]